jgi:hypothetical protein
MPSYINNQNLSAFFPNESGFVSKHFFSVHCSAPFALVLVQNRPQFSSAADMFYRPLLRSAAEISAGWQHCNKYRYGMILFYFQCKLPC